jgi:hypothetical protein
MRLFLLSVAGLSSVLAARPASAATIVVYTHPESLERRVVVVDRDGPDRLIMCMLPPGEAGCHLVKARRGN